MDALCFVEECSLVTSRALTLDVLAGCAITCALETLVVWTADGVVGALFVALVFQSEEDGLQVEVVCMVTTKAFCCRGAGVAR